MYHRSVLLRESIEGLNIVPNGVYVDATFGGGGHSRAILERLGEDGRLVAFDQDADALQNGLEDERFRLVHGNFRFLSRFLKFYGIDKVDGVLADFGVSSHQFDVPERGFSTRFEAMLDMRMDQRAEKSAVDMVNTYAQTELERVLGEYGELRSARKMAAAIVAYREKSPLRTSVDLRDAIAAFLPKGRENKTLAQLYQAIRIEVNGEIGALKEFLTQIPQVLKPDGRLVLISYHSLEDRLVKRYIRDGKFEGEATKDFYGNVKVPLKKVGGLIVPQEEEIKGNNRARSAKLRVAERF